MLNVLGEISMFAAFLVPPVVFGLGLYRLRDIPMNRRFPAALCFAVTAFIIFFVFFWSVFWRDGMAPGLVPSHGFTALARTADGLVAWVVAVPFTYGGWRLSGGPMKRNLKVRA
jgi:hypothetical protein